MFLEIQCHIPDVQYVKSIKRIIKDCDNEFNEMEEKGLEWEIMSKKRNV